MDSIIAIDSVHTCLCLVSILSPLVGFVYFLPLLQYSSCLRFFFSLFFVIITLGFGFVLSMCVYLGLTGHGHGSLIVYFVPLLVLFPEACDVGVIS